MKLSDLINIKEVINDLDYDYNIEQLVINLANIVESTNYEINEPYVSFLRDHNQQIQNDVKEFTNTFERLKKALEAKIISHDQKYLELDQQYWNEFKQDLSHTILNRQFDIDSISSVLLKSRLDHKVSWQYPGLIFRPKHAVYLEGLVAADPMYWVDTDQDLLDSVGNLFSPEYQRRICKYVLPDAEQVDLSSLPAEQFGLVYACWFLNFRSLPVIEQYLTQVFKLLRPGGQFVFTYNNCDTHSGILRFDRHGGCYTPSRLLTAMAKRIGYEIEYNFSDSRGLSWIELRRPGQLSSIRAGQTLAAIKQNQEWVNPNHVEMANHQPNVAVPVDFDHRDVYTELTLLIEIATMLGLDLNMSLSKGQPHPKKLRKMISAHFRSESFPVEKITRLLAKRKTQ